MALKSFFFLIALYIPFVLCVSPLVDLGYTKLQGVAGLPGTTQWLGIRYAAAPIGQLRFANPQEPPSTEGVVDSTKVCTIEIKEEMLTLLQC